MSVNSFTFGGISTEDFGLYVGGQNTFNSPQRDVTKISIPGRNGDLIHDNGRFYNVQVAYSLVAMPEAISTDFITLTNELKAALMSVKGYARLEDTYQPTHFRMARVSDAIVFQTGAYNLHGKTQIVFDCMPQKFLTSGEIPKIIDPITVVSKRNIVNPTAFDSRPLITINGSGTCTATIGNQIITVTDVDGYVDIDCETMNCYKGTTNMNSKVTLGVQGFPVLHPGATGLAVGGNTTSLEVTGRWWEL